MVDIIDGYAIDRNKICYITPYYRIENNRYFSIVFDGGHKIEFMSSDVDRDTIVILFEEYNRNK